MSNDNYPAGVTDAHPHFNPDERPVTVSCTTEEALVVPSFAVKAELNDLQEFVTRLAKQAVEGDMPWASETLGSINDRISAMRERVEDIEREGGYECQWVGELELAVSEEAEFDCPRCGVEQTTDTIPEDRDPDEGWDNRHDD